MSCVSLLKRSATKRSASAGRASNAGSCGACSCTVGEARLRAAPTTNSSRSAAGSAAISSAPSSLSCKRSGCGRVLLQPGLGATPEPPGLRRSGANPCSSLLSIAQRALCRRSNRAATHTPRTGRARDARTVRGCAGLGKRPRLSSCAAFCGSCTSTATSTSCAAQAAPSPYSPSAICDPVGIADGSTRRIFAPTGARACVTHGR